MSHTAVLLRYAALLGVLAFSSDAPTRADDGKRKVEVPRFGVRVRVPQAWELIDWARDDTAFVLQTPQDGRSEAGDVSCRITPGSGNLEAIQTLLQQEAREAKAPATIDAAAPAAGVKQLLKVELAELKSPAFPPEFVEQFHRRLTAEWSFVDAKQRQYFERRVYLQGESLLYTFDIASDEAHYDSYVIDFEEMIAGAELKPLELALERLPSGHWLQRDFRFGLQLPEGWRPNFGAGDRVLFFATGASHGVFHDSLAVQASPAKPLDLQQLAAEMPDLVKRKDAAAQTTAKIVPQGGRDALETTIRTRRGKLEIVTIERRFATARRCYEVRLTCAAAEFQRREAELRATLDSFIELEPKTAGGNET
ncbi:MAG: hypothetical protein C0483_16760 [Pirellula sp.]|nr:hypothetical protein [Pirellula sp.]